MIFIDAEELVYGVARELIVHTPYNKGFVDDLKSSVHKSWRRWSPDDRAWEVSIFAFGDLLKLLKGCFGAVEIEYSPSAEKAIRKYYPKFFGDGSSGPNACGSGSPYDVLYLKNDAPMSVVVGAYKALSKEHHPDMGGDRAVMAKINKAFDEIKKKM